MKKRSTDEIANIIHKLKDNPSKGKVESLDYIASSIAITFARENSRFNWQQFMDLCNGGDNG